MECVAVATLIKDLEEGCLSSSSVERITKSVLTKASKELSHYIGKLSSGLTLLEDLLNAVQYLVKRNTSCFTHLHDAGLLDLFCLVFEKLLGRLTRDGSCDKLQLIVELCIETVNVLADLNSFVKSTVVLSMAPYFLDLLEHQLLNFQTRMEVLKSTNSLLEQCPTKTKESLLQITDNYMKIMSLVDLVKTVGDYEFQVGILECLMRLFPKKSRQIYATKFFTDGEMLQGFLEIKDKDFETDCRMFLNQVNAKLEDPNKGVFSLPCVSAFIGNKQLRKPSDGGYDEFWVDFNIGSERMTLFCEQESLLSQGTPMDEALWETVAIYKADVNKCTCNEIDGCIILEICLNSPVCDIYPSQHQDVTDNKIKIEFHPDLEEHITHAIGLTFNFTEKKNKVSTVAKSIHISMKQVQETDSQPSVPTKVQTKSPCIRGSPESVTKRCKVSVPCILMNKPASTPISTPVIVATNGEEVQSETSVSTEHFFDKKPSRSKDKMSVGDALNHKATSKTSSDNQVKILVSRMNGKENCKRDLNKKDGNTKAFLIPTTPVQKVQRTSKPKWKTPVVTVTPPSKQKKDRKCKNRDKKITREETKPPNVFDLSETSHRADNEETIPESVPFCEEENCNKVMDQTKASTSVNNFIDDSGIDIQYSRSTVGNITISVDDPETDFANKEVIVVEKKTTEKPLIIAEAKHKLKKEKIKEKQTTKAAYDSEDVCNLDNTVKEMNKHKKTASKYECQNKLTNCTRLPKISAKKTQPKSNSFGFDEIAEDFEIDIIPDSSEQCQLDQTNQTHSINENINKSMPETYEEEIVDESKSVSRSKKKKCKKDGKNMKNEKSEEIKIENAAQKSIPVKSSKDNGEKDAQTTDYSIPEIKMEKKQRKSFTDEDTSFKELCALDDQDCNSTTKNGEHILNKDRSNLEENNNVETSESTTLIDNVYTFCEPDENFSTLAGEREKKNLKLSKEQKKSKLSKSGKKVGKMETVPDKNFKKEKQKKNKQNKNFDLIDLNEVITKNNTLANETSRSLRSRSNSIIPEETIYSDYSSISENSPNSLIHSEEKKDEHLLKSDNSSSDAKEKQKFSNDVKKDSIVKEKNNPETSLARKESRKSRVSFNIHGSESPETLSNKAVTPSKIKTANKIEVSFQTEDYIKTKHDEDLNQTNIRTDSEKDSQDDECVGNTLITNKKSDDSKITTNESDKKNNVEDLNQNDNSAINDTVSSSLSDSDCLYIESDDSYNARRYRLDNNEPSKSEKKRRKSVAAKIRNVKEESVNEYESASVIDNLPSEIKMKKSADEPAFKHKNKDKLKKKHLSEEKDACNIAEGSVNKVRIKKKTIQKMLTVKTEHSADDMDDDSKENEFILSNSLMNESRSGNCKRKKILKSRNRNDSDNKSMSLSMEEKIESMECDDGFANVSQGKINSKSKNMVFQLSYSRSHTNFKSKGSTLHERHVTKSTSYDPYDFEAQCETASLRSENLDRENIAKQLNTDHRNLKKKKDLTKKQSKHRKESIDSVKSDVDADVEEYYNDTNVSIKENARGWKDGSDLHEKFDRSMIDVDESDKENRTPSPVKDEQKLTTTLMQDKKTNKWYRPFHEYNNRSKHDVKVIANKNRKDALKVHTVADRSIDLYNTDSDGPETNTAEIKSEQQMDCSDQTRSEECGLNNFSKILMDITSKRIKKEKKTSKTKFTSKQNDEVEMELQDTKGTNFGEVMQTIATNKDKHEKRVRRQKPLRYKAEEDKENFQAKLDASLGEIMMTPCITSVSSTPKVGSSKRKHYHPLNISVIKTPQSCQSIVQDDYEDSDEVYSTKQSKDRRRKKSVQYKDLSDCEISDDKSINQRMSLDTSLLSDSRHGISNRSEKSWILEHKKTPKLKKGAKTYNKQNNSQHFGSQAGLPVFNSQTDDSQDEEKQMDICSLPFPSVAVINPAVIPSLKNRSNRSWDNPEDIILSSVTPQKSGRHKHSSEDDIDVFQTQENYLVSLNMSCDNLDEIGSVGMSGLSGRTPLVMIQDEDSNKISAHKSFRQSMKTLLGDSGFASGPSSEARPTRSTLKRKYPKVQEKEESSACSDIESCNEMERSTFIPKKLFKFDPSSLMQMIDTPMQVPSVYDSTTTDTEGLDLTFQSGLSTFVSAFGADIQKQLKAKKQRFESCIHQTLKDTQKRFSQTWTEQQQYQSNIVDDYQAKMLLELTALDKDINNIKEAEQKYEEFFKNQMQILHGNAESQKKRLDNMRSLQAGFTERTKKVNKYNHNIHKNMKEQLKRDMTVLQQRLLRENQKQELMNVKRGLQNLF